MKNRTYSKEKLEDINLIINAFKVQNVNLTEEQAHFAYTNWSQENYFSGWTSGLDTWSEKRIVEDLKDYIPEYKRKFIKENKEESVEFLNCNKEFLYSINDEKFFWKMLLPKKGLRFAKTVDEIEFRKVCLTKEHHLRLLNSIEYNY